MLTDEDLILQMKLQTESPDDPWQRKIVKPKYPESIFKLDELVAKIGERVWVKCITDLQPWADEKPLKLWGEYFIPVSEAIDLDRKRFAVIMHSQAAFKEMENLQAEELEEAPVVALVTPAPKTAKPRAKSNK